MSKIPPRLQATLDRMYRKAIDPQTSDTYASVLRSRARQLCLAPGVPRANWPHWTEEGVAWQDRGDRTEEVKYPPGLTPEIMSELEHYRLNNSHAKARALCRALGISPPSWARR